MAICAMSAVRLVQNEVLQSRGFALMAVYLLMATDVKVDSTSQNCVTVKHLQRQEHIAAQLGSGPS